MKRIILILIVLLAMLGQVAYAQKTCVIASAENHVPIREALIHTNNNHWARTDYRGYWTMRYQFDSATVSKPGFMKATIRYSVSLAGCQTIRRSDSLGQKSGRHQKHGRGYSGEDKLFANFICWHRV